MSQWSCCTDERFEIDLCVKKVIIFTLLYKNAKLQSQISDWVPITVYSFGWVIYITRNMVEMDMLFLEKYMWIPFQLRDGISIN